MSLRPPLNGRALFLHRGVMQRTCVYLRCDFVGFGGQGDYARACAALLAAPPEGWSCQRVEAADPRSGVSRAWMRLHRGEKQLFWNGYALVEQGVGVEQAQLLLPQAAGGACRPRRVCTISAGPGEVLELLALWTTAMLLLDRSALTSKIRPSGTTSNVDQCARWLRSYPTRFFVGRGARERVIEPWTTYIDRYSGQIEAVKEFWECALRRRVDGMPADHPLAGLLLPLLALSTERDERAVLAEYRSRLNDLRREGERVTTEIGAVLVLVSIALVPFGSVFWGILVAPVLAAALVYYFAYDVMVALVRARRRFARGRRAVRAPDEAAGLAGHSLARFGQTVLAQPALVLASSRVALAEFAAAASLWLHLLQHHQGEPAERSVLFAGEPLGLRGRATVCFGGPLVQPRSALPRPACDLRSDSAYRNWHYGTDRPVLAVEEDELAGCVSCSEDAPAILFVTGFREAGAVIASQWLIARLRGAAGGLPPRMWCVIRPGRTRAGVAV